LALSWKIHGIDNANASRNHSFIPNGMNFISLPTEQTTAITDLLLAFVSLTLCILFRETTHGAENKKVLFWTGIFGFLAIASLLGAFVHGITLKENDKEILWHIINFCLGSTVAFFILAVLFDLNHRFITIPVVIAVLFSSLIFFTITLFSQGSFLVFILYESGAMLFALSGYLYLAVKRKSKFARLMVTGILISILASVIQATGFLKLHLVWDFDHNGLFHISQIPGLFFLYKGLKTETRLKNRN
jgi:hypothetical protein